MVVLMMGEDMRAMDPRNLVYWGAMSLSITVGFIVAFPVNLWLVWAGLKHGMGTERALGKGGHSAAVEEEALRSRGAKRGAAKPRAAAHGTHGGSA
jgi:uncharacterized protein DUF4396